MMGKTTKADLIEAIHTNGNLNYKEVHGLIDALFDEIKGAMLAGKTVELRGGLRYVRGKEAPGAETGEEPKDWGDRRHRGSWGSSVPARARTQERCLVGKANCGESPRENRLDRRRYEAGQSYVWFY
jgi:hypothetical protein